MSKPREITIGHSICAEVFEDESIAGDITFVEKSALDEAQDKIMRLEKFIRDMIAHAGHPDPAVGCRMVIKKGQSALDREADQCE